MNASLRWRAYGADDGIEMRAEAVVQIDLNEQVEEQCGLHKRISENIGLSWMEAYVCAFFHTKFTFWGEPRAETSFPRNLQ
jgi:hypothetical protein